MNLSELAHHLEISPSTVSRVLSGNAEKYRISAETVARVRAAAEEFQVSPDPLGSSLRSGRMGMVGLLLPDITNPFFAGLAREIELALRGRGMTLQLCDSAENAETEIQLLRQMVGRRLDGMILAPTGGDSDEISRLVASTKIPVIALDRIVPNLAVPTVCLDNHAAGVLAARRLVAAGHAKIGCLRGAPETFIDQERYRGVSETLENAGITLATDFVAGAGYSRESSIAGARIVLGGTEFPDAVIALSGQGTLGLLEVASEKGIGIPRDVSLVVFDEQPWSAFMKPPLTTIAQPVAEMAREAVRLLDQALRSGNESASRLSLPARLIERDSVRRG